MKQIDYSKIVLTEEQQTIFNKFAKRDKVLLSLDEYNALRKTSLLLPAINENSTWFGITEGGICELSKYGKAYRTFQKKSLKKEKTESFRFWLPLVISNCIAVAALIVAILAYIKQ